ncbi:hypothetical protein MHB65_22145 [Lysinibacillus sp. FSL K6-0075]|uniref:hypothetical protein n=1 Tax=Lysinibacillus sp. FSL K6-0075 TaxID=2921415 RepID=UPI0031581970
MATNKIQEKIESVKNEDVKEAITATLQTFTKEQLVKSNKYVHRRDALNALLQDNKLYSFTEVEGILKQFEEGGKA